MLISPRELFELFLSGEVSALLYAFINWGLLMALLVNIVNYSEPRNRPTSALWICVVVCLSYTATSFVGRELSKYLIWMAADLITILLLVIVQSKRQRIASFYYCILVLLLNALLHLVIYIDVAFFDNYDPWWLWSIYAVGVNVNDLVLVIALILNKDFLGFCRLGTSVNKHSLKRIKRQESNG
ncbi:hypothetical protein [Pseudoalteromonas pernae]|uniref:hypothetical protein n=1 Tax=Pseudoalteromonas pernae TaxID=3118054 RepID=UPI003242E24F